MRKCLLALTAAAALAAGCDNKSTRPSPLVDEAAADTTAASDAVTDSTLYGICGDGSAMNTLQLITDEGDTVVLSIADANDTGQCYGSFQSGDRMAVILKDASTAAQVVNMTVLTGDWLSSSSSSSSSQSGIRLKADGQAENIGTGPVAYRSWRLLNGQLEIESASDGKTEVGLYDIVAIGPDSLVFKDDARRFEFSRK